MTPILDDDYRCEHVSSQNRDGQRVSRADSFARVNIVADAVTKAVNTRLLIVFTPTDLWILGAEQTARMNRRRVSAR